MSLSITIGPLTPDEINRVVAALTAAGLATGAMVAAGAGMAPPMAAGAPPVPPPVQGMAPPPPMAPAAPPAPPAPPAAAAPPVNPRLANVLTLMGAYAKHGHGAAGAKKVLAQVGIQRAQDADETQLVWLEQAFANVNWAPA